MGLSSSMWTSVSGLLSHGNKMNVVGNNIANVSTIGFKSQRMDFNDYLYISGGSTSGPTQIGAGVANYAVIGDFSQGSLEATNSVTDLAIDGSGFFKVRQPNSEQTYYTRAGDFYFNADRQLQNPEGYRLQGWKIDNSTRLTFKSDSVNLGKDLANESAFQGTGTPVDIVLDSWYLEPQRTSSINFTMGLTSDGKSDRSTSTNSPMTALFDQWDATKNPPMADSSYATSSSIKVYDEGGTPHTLTVYYDQVATQAKDSEGNLLYEIEGLPAGYTMYEYVVTIPPEEDMRSYGGTGFNDETNEFDGTQPTRFYNDPVNGTNKMAGMMMTGHMIFDAAGNLVNQTAYSYGATADIDNNDQCALDPKQLGSWQATKFSSNGLPTFCANFTGQPLANSVNEKISATESQAQDYLIELDFGLRNTGDWNYAGTLDDLIGALEPPATNTETRISLATTTAYHQVEFRKKDAKLTSKKKESDTASAALWEVKDNDKLPTEMQNDTAKVSEEPNIYLQINSDTRVQIAYDKNGPKTIWVNPTTGKTMSIQDMKALEQEIDKATTEYNKLDAEIANLNEQYKTAKKNGDSVKEAQLKVQIDALVPSRTELNTKINELKDKKATYKEAIQGIDGKPIRDSEKKLLEDVKFNADGTLKDVNSDKYTFVWERNLKTIPNNVLNGDYQQVVTGGGDMIDIDLTDNIGEASEHIYAISDGGQKLQVKIEDGLVVGVRKKETDPWDDYDGEKLYFDKAVAHRTIDYNKDVSTYGEPVRTENATKAGSSSFITQDAGQNGYASGVLSGTNITADGVVYGYYDNGETVPLYQIALYDFHNLQGLRREGGNLYGQTRESGEARQGVAGEAGFGSVKAYNIEGSNVDLSREFVNMITTQRGFQANSKGITTVDTMLETVIGMKR